MTTPTTFWRLAGMSYVQVRPSVRGRGFAPVGVLDLDSLGMSCPSAVVFACGPEAERRGWRERRSMGFGWGGGTAAIGGTMSPAFVGSGAKITGSLQTQVVASLGDDWNVEAPSVLRRCGRVVSNHPVCLFLWPYGSGYVSAVSRALFWHSLFGVGVHSLLEAR